MGKKQHQKDKLYLTCTEWNTIYGGKKANDKNLIKFKRLPFSCCSISLQPFTTPYCTKEGYIFDLSNIVPFVKKYGINPVTGAKLKLNDLTKLNFHKNQNGKYHCPVTYKVFNENTHIVAIKVTGNVYAYEAIERLNLKINSLLDLLTNDPFQKSDIIQIQNPSDLQKFDINAFHHIRTAESASDFKQTSTIRSLNPETKETLSSLAESEIVIPDYMYKNKTEKAKETSLDEFNKAHYSTGAAAHSFTSTVMEPVNRIEAAVLADDIVKYRFVKKKGYVRLVTTHGNLNLELFCNLVPKTCENFIRHCESGYYNDTEFHRVVRHFVLQGGDPTGKGTGGDSCWGGSFEDEFLPQLSHDTRGVLSMANSGPNTNRSQFFITFRPCKQLNKKHTIFGKVVGGLETLNNIEWLPVDADDRPLEKVTLLSAKVFVNPFKEAEEELLKEREEGAKPKGPRVMVVNGITVEFKPGNKREEEEFEARLRAQESVEKYGVAKHRDGIGKFISEEVLKTPGTPKRPYSTPNTPIRPSEDDDFEIESETSRKKRNKVYKTNLSDFSAW